MEKEFVPYELALKLKELGFNEECGAYYSPMDNKLSNIGIVPISSRVLKAPLWQQAFDWFRERGYESEINRNIPEMESRGFKKYSFYIWSEKTNPRGNFTDRKLNSVDTYNEARQACLEKLIEMYKKN